MGVQIPGATVWVAPGTYDEHDIAFPEKSLSLHSTHGPSMTTIDARQAGQVMSFKNLEEYEILLEGFTVTGGLVAEADGAGILISWSSPTLRHLAVTENYGIGDNVTGNLNGGGISIDTGDPVIEFCVISRNSARFGGGIFMSGSNGAVTNCRIEENVAYNGGGGIYGASSNPSIAHVIISSNESLGSGGGLHWDFGGGSFSHCVFSDNFAQTVGGGIYLLTAPTSFTHCVIAANTSSDEGGGFFVMQLTDASVSNSVIAYNAPYNVYGTGINRMAFRNSDIYNPADWPDVMRMFIGPDNLRTEPAFLTYEDGLPTDFHLAQGSPLIGRGGSRSLDVDGSKADIGCYGGADAAQRDMDGDTVPDWFWPGTLEMAPVGFDPEDYDCDERGGARQQCGD